MLQCTSNECQDELRDYGTTVNPSEEPFGAPAADLIRAEIVNRGPITFARFMELALYAPEVGYYQARAAEDFHRDYVTSPELHPAFGVLLCGQIEEMWRRLGRPDEFWLVEGGPGTGAFAGDVLATAVEAYPALAQALRFALIERSPALREMQRGALERSLDRVLWLDLDDAAGAAPLGPGCVFANELLDALAVHRVVMREGGLREVYVGIRDDGFVGVEDEPSTSLLREQITAGGGCLRRDDRGEVNLDAPRWVTSAAMLLERGYVLLLDYGEPADVLYGEKHPRGTLRCYWRHTMNRHPYARVGLQDMTAHVDLSAVARAGAGAGLSLLGATHQTHLLRRLGLDVVRRRVDREIAGRVERRAHHAAFDLLSDPRHLGRVSALLMGKGVDGAEPLSGFLQGGEAVAAPRVPALDLRIRDASRLAAALRE